MNLSELSTEELKSLYKKAVADAVIGDNMQMGMKIL